MEATTTTSSTTEATTSYNSLPAIHRMPNELWQRVFSYLSSPQHELYSFSLINRRLFYNVSPLLYRSIPLHSLSLPQLQTLNHALKTNPVYLDYIQHLTLDFKARSFTKSFSPAFSRLDDATTPAINDFSSFLPVMRCLKSLTIREYNAPSDSALLALLSHIPSCTRRFDIKILNITPQKTLLSHLLSNPATSRLISHCYLSSIFPKSDDSVSSFLSQISSLGYLHLDLKGPDQNRRWVQDPQAIPESVRQLAIQGVHVPRELPAGVKAIKYTGHTLLSDEAWEALFEADLEELDLFLNPGKQQKERVQADNGAWEIREAIPPPALGVATLPGTLRVLKIWSAFEGFNDEGLYAGCMPSLGEKIKYKRYFPEGLLGRVFEGNKGLEDVSVDSMTVGDLRRLLGGCKGLKALRWFFARAEWVEENEVVTLEKLVEEFKRHRPAKLERLSYPAAPGLQIGTEMERVVELCPRLEEYRCLSVISKDGVCAPTMGDRMFMDRFCARKGGVPLRGFPDGLEMVGELPSDRIGDLECWEVDVKDVRRMMRNVGTLDERMMDLMI
jgi:hypothetical protein